MLEITPFTFGPFATNCYVLASADEILLVDPCCASASERQTLLNHIEKLTADNPRPVTIVATHGHLDHLWGAAWACRQWNTPVLMHGADIPMAQAMQDQYTLFGIPGNPEPFPLKPIADSQQPMAVLHTPGHTPGSVCFYWEKEKLLISGDTLFHMGYGRTDLPGGNMGQLIQSLETLLALPEDVAVYSGHGDLTTIGAEKRYF